MTIVKEADRVEPQAVVKAMARSGAFYPKGTTVERKDTSWERAEVMFAVLAMNFGPTVNIAVIARLAKVIEDYRRADGDIMHLRVVE
jgi:hypothetical protein